MQKCRCQTIVIPTLLVIRTCVVALLARQVDRLAKVPAVDSVAVFMYLE